MPGKHWTPDEEAYLRDNWGKVSYQEIAKDLCKHPKSLHGKALRMGLALAKQPAKPKKSNWAKWKASVAVDAATDSAVAKALSKAPKRTLGEARERMKRKPGRIVALCGWRGLSR